MRKISITKAENYFEAFLFIALFALSFYLVKSFILPIFFASALVFLSYGAYKRLDSKVKNESLSALLIMLCVMIMLLFPTYWVFSSLIVQTGNLVETSQDAIDNIDLSSCPWEICRSIEESVNSTNVNFDLIFNNMILYFTESLGVIFDSLTDFFVNFFVFLFAFFYLLRDGQDFVRYIKRVIPMKSEYKNALFLKFRDVSLAVFVNTILVAMMQGALVGIMFWILGIKAPVFWAVIASFAALLPLFGPSLVWGPAALYLFLSNRYIAGTILLVYGLLVVSIADNVARPYLLKRSVKVHEFLILLSILGGIKVFGFFMGIFLGPLIISFLVAVLNLYGLDFTHEETIPKEPNIFK